MQNKMVGNNKSVKRPKLMDLFTVSIIRSISALLFLYLDSPQFILSRTALEFISCVNKSGRPNIQMLGSLGVIQLPLSNMVSSYLTKSNIFSSQQCGGDIQSWLIYEIKRAKTWLMPSKHHNWCISKCSVYFGKKKCIFE